MIQGYNGQTKFKIGARFYNPLLQETYTIESTSMRPTSQKNDAPTYTMTVDPPSYKRKDRETGEMVTVKNKNKEINHRVLITMPWQIL